jgi:hypothetical protein
MLQRFEGRGIVSRQTSIRIIAVLLVFAISQAYTQLSFFASAAPTSSTFPPQQMVARLTTKGNLPITVNGTSASSGDSIVTDALIETPANVNATIDLGPLGSLDIEPGSKIKLEFNGDCTPPAPGEPPPTPLQKCSVKVTVLAGCVAAHHKKGSYFEVVDENQKLLKESDKSRKREGVLPFCFPGAAAPSGLTTLTKVLIAALVVGGGGVAWWLLDDNPSPSGT